MLDKLHYYAVRLSWMRLVVVLPGLAAFSFAVYIAFSADTATTDQFFIPALLLSFWCLLIYCLISVFQQGHPAIDINAGFFRRLSIKFRRGIRAILALAFLVLTGSLAVVSFKLLSTGLG